MRKIINNKVYDTSSAKLRGEWSNNRGYNDFSWCKESLYEKKTGEFFLYGCGGPMSRYAEATGSNSWSGGARIIPLSVSAARIWAETHLSAEEYEELFGPVIEDDSRVIQAFSLAADSLEILRRTSRETGAPMGVILDGLIKGQYSMSLYIGSK